MSSMPKTEPNFDVNGHILLITARIAIKIIHNSMSNYLFLSIKTFINLSFSARSSSRCFIRS